MNDAESFLLAKGYKLINGEWFAPSRLPHSAVNQPDPAVEQVAAGPRTIADAVRRVVRIKSYRVRLIDGDAVWVKYIIDALRYAGILRDDTTEWLEIQTPEQIKVSHKRFERTEVEII